MPAPYTAVGLIPVVRGEIARNLDHLAHPIEAATWLSSLDLPVRLIAIPAGARQGFNDEVLDLDHATFAREVAIDLPGPETRFPGDLARRWDAYILAQAKARHEAFPDRFFNVGFALDPRGEIILRHHKLAPLYPAERSVTPHDVWDRWVELYGRSLDAFYPVADTAIGRLGVMMANEASYPENARGLALNGAEVVYRASYPHPHTGNDFSEIQNRARALDNNFYVVAPNMGTYYLTADSDLPIDTFGGRSMVVDYKGRVVGKQPHGAGATYVAGTIDVGALRDFRTRAQWDNWLQDLRTEVYQAIYERPIYPKNLYLDRAPFTVTAGERMRRIAGSKSPAWPGLPGEPPGGEGMLRVAEWIAIRDLARRGLGVSEIARQTGRDRKTVRKVLTETPPPLARRRGAPRPSKLDPFRAYLAGRMAQGCLNGAVLLEEIRQRGYAGGVAIRRGIRTPARRERVRQREATTRSEAGPGQQAQVDWAKFGKIWVPAASRWRTLWAFLFTLGFSRAHYLEFVLTCDMEHFLDCHLSAFAALGIPQTILCDNLKTGILGRQLDGTPLLPGRFADFAPAHGFTPAFCPPCRARTKGKVERTVGYVRQSFRARGAAAVAARDLDLVGLNAAACEWVGAVANVRVPGTHGEVVAVRYAAEAGHLGHLGGRPRYDTAYHHLRRVGRDGRLAYRGQVFQLPLAHALSTVEVIEDLRGRISLRAAKGHALPVVGAPAGLPAADVGPSAPAAPPAAGPPLRPVDPTAPVVETRDLAVYEEGAHAAGLA